MEVHLNHEADSFVWKLTPLGPFTVKSMYITTILKVNKHLFSQNFEATSEFHPCVVSVLS
jgi:hypothetical protein